MFPATVLVAILTGFDVGVTLFASGLATVVALLGSGMRIPLYYGSSFSYIAAVVGQWSAPSGAACALPRAASWPRPWSRSLAGFLIRWVGKEALDRVLPPIVTGSVAIVIGISLAKTALGHGLGGSLVASASLPR
jgi:uracil permease